MSTAEGGELETKCRVKAQFSFALYAAASRVVRQHRPLLEPLGLTYPQYLVMLALYEGFPRSVGEIGGMLGMDNGTLTPLLKRLVSAGLVTRERDPADERRVLIGLTDAAETLREELRSIGPKIEALCIEPRPDAEFARLRDTLNGIGRVAPLGDAPGGSMDDEHETQDDL